MTRPEHPILRRPFPITTAPESVETPKHFKELKPELPAHLPAHAVFAKPQPYGGVITTEVGFEDAPDAEIIAGGIHSRHPDAPAIARHGSFVMWGFDSSPDQMTPNGQRLLLNVLAYAVAHRGERPVVRVLSRARGFARRPAAERPFLHAAGAEIPCVDEQARAIGVANNSLAFLGELSKRLASDPSDVAARALVERYLPDAPVEHFADWLVAHEGDLFFSDWGGYRWYSRRAVLHACGVPGQAPGTGR